MVCCCVAAVVMQVVQAVHAAVEAALAGQNKQDRLRAQMAYGFNQVGALI